MKEGMVEQVSELWKAVVAADTSASRKCGIKGGRV